MCGAELHRIDWQPTLVGASIRLRPLTVDDRDALFLAACDPLIWELHPAKNRYERAEFDKYFDAAIASAGALIMIDRKTSSVIGCSRYYDWNAEKREIAIGHTFLVRSYWGGKANAEVKALMLQHAFLFANRVWFHVWADNFRSRGAMEKIGGVLDHHGKIEFNGKMLDYCYYVFDPP
jgi:N-acetyltransferase